MRGRSTAAAVFHGVAASVLVAAANLATGVVVARSLGVEGRGVLAALILLPSLLPAFLTLGVPSMAVYEVRSHPNVAGAAMAFNVIAGVILATIGAVAAMLMTPYLLASLPPLLAAPAILLAGLTFPSVLVTFLLAGLQARQEFTAYNAVRYAHPMLVLLAIAALASSHLLTPVRAALVILTAGLPGLAWSAWWVHREYRPNLSWSRTLIAGWLHYSLRVYSTDLLLAVSTQLDKLIVVAVFAPTQLGIYTVAINLSRLAGMFSSAVAAVLFPKASGRAIGDVIEMTSRAACATVLTGGGIAFGLFAFAHLLLRWVYGAEFAQGAAALQVLVIEALVASLAQVLSQAFLALNRPGLVSVQCFAGLGAELPLLVLLAPRFGAEGAAVALLAGSAVRLTATHASFRLGLGTDAPRIWLGLRGSLGLVHGMLQAGRR